MTEGQTIIGVVGVCGSGKTTLVKGLSLLGINVRHIAQEHSYVPSMWKRITNPDILIYLQASYIETIRRKHLNWTEEEYLEQLNRLSNAKEHADLIIDTNLLDPHQIIDHVIIFLEARGVYGSK